MFEKLISHPLEKLIGLYVLTVIGNVTTGIINDAIDEVIPQVDSTSASLLGILRFMLNFEGALILTFVGFIIWFISQMKN
jgi:hypothetical protein